MHYFELIKTLKQKKQQLENTLEEDMRHLESYKEMVQKYELIIESIQTHIDTIDSQLRK